MSAGTYKNPTPLGRVTVKRELRSYDFPLRFTDGTTARVERAWAIKLDGRATGWHVVSTRTGMTLRKPDGSMATGWHAGPTAGELARFHANMGRDFTG